MALECPFCPFTDEDSYSIIEHVECCHPENGESPFVVKPEEEISRPEGGNDEEATWSGVPSQDEDYFECHCGEVVILSEVDSHMALHESEETAVGEALSAAILRPSKNAVLNEGDLTIAPMPDCATFSGNPPSTKLHSKQRSRAENHKGHHGHHGVKDLVGLMLGSKSSGSRPKTSKARHKNTRRLGVRNLFQSDVL